MKRKRCAQCGRALYPCPLKCGKLVHRYIERWPGGPHVTRFSHYCTAL